MVLITRMILIERTENDHENNDVSNNFDDNIISDNESNNDNGNYKGKESKDNDYIHYNY